MRAKAAIEEGKRGQMQIVVTELPYQTSCSAIAGRIQELVDAGDLEGIADVNDGSAGGKTSLVVTLKRDANANVVLNNLFKLTQLQTSFGVNMVALVDGVPSREGPQPRSHPRGAPQGAQCDRCDHRPHPGERRRTVGQGSTHG